MTAQRDRGAEMMRTWQSDDPGIAALRVAEQARPVPGSGEYLVRVEAAALNFSDILMVRGHYQIRPPRPFVPGQEICGTIETAGPDTSLAEGDRVAGKVLWGGFADYALMRADMALGIPSQVPATEASALPVSYTTALVAIDHCAALTSGQTILIHSAAGGLGLAAVQVAVARGATVFGTAGGLEKHELVLANGADAVFASRGKDWRKQVLEATGELGVDVVLDTIGGAVTLESIRALRYGGTLLIAGFLSGDVPDIAAHRLLLKRLRAVGVYWNHDMTEDKAMLSDIQKQIVDMYLDKKLRPHIGEVYGFSQLPDALNDLDQGRARGKLVVELE